MMIKNSSVKIFPQRSSYYEEESEKIMIDIHTAQERFVEKLYAIVQKQSYKGILIFCGNFLLGINKKGECVPCIPECYIQNGKVINRDNLHLCYRKTMNKFDTRFSYFSLQVGLKLYQKTHVEKQLLLSADDKYIPATVSKAFHRKGYKAIPEIYRNMIEKNVPGTKKHLKNIISALNNAGCTKYNDFILSERALVRGFHNNKKRGIEKYNDYYLDLYDDVTSCSLELFHLLEIIKQEKKNIFHHIGVDEKIGVFMFIPDACVSSAMQGGLAVSKTDKNFEIINITQTSTIKGNTIMITKIAQGGVERL